MKTLLLQFPLLAWSSRARAFRDSTRIAHLQVAPGATRHTSGSEVIGSDTRTSGEPVQRGHAGLVWRTVEMEDGRLEWRVVENLSVLMAGQVVGSPNGVAA